MEKKEETIFNDTKHNDKKDANAQTKIDDKKRINSSFRPWMIAFYPWNKEINSYKVNRFWYQCPFVKLFSICSTYSFSRLISSVLKTLSDKQLVTMRDLYLSSETNEAELLQVHVDVCLARLDSLYTRQKF